jgi:hypothetical protein
VRRWTRQKHDDTETALANFALTFAKALLVFCVILFVMITDDQKKEDGITPKVEAVIMVEWPSAAKVDVDTWMRDPEGRILYYENKEVGIVFLDRDDRGVDCIAVCSEITSLRGLNAGEYVLNLNVFGGLVSIPGAPLREPLTVHVRIIKMNPSVSILWERDIVLTYVKEERHVVRFQITNGEIGQFDSEQTVYLQTRPGK